MSRRATITFSDATYEAALKLSKLENRSFSNCIDAIVTRALPELRQEWQRQGQVASLPTKKTRRNYDEIEDMPLHPE